MKLNKIIVFIVPLILAGCMGGVSTPTHYKVNTKPYTVAGKTYYPMASADGFSETGTASWYGPGFHGKKTASGERYNQHAFTAAHKTLPFGTRLKVTNLDNNLNTVVVVNDRGPFKKGRIIDLSNAAAKQINMTGAGTARVHIQSIGSTNVVSNTKNTTSTVSSGRYYVQIGAYSSRDNASSVATKLSNSGYKYRIKSSSGNYVVQAGPYSSQESAQSARDKLRKTYSGAFIAK